MVHALLPGRTYSWKIASQNTTSQVFGDAVATFFVMLPEDAAPIKRELERLSKTRTATPAEARLRQAGVFERFGVWYDALKIATEEAEARPHDSAAQQLYETLVKKLYTAMSEQEKQP